MGLQPETNPTFGGGSSLKAVGYVSDENFLALHDVQVELQPLSGGDVALLRSSPTGTLYTDVPAGLYKVFLAKDGYGPKWVECELGTGEPHQFRLMSDSIAGFMWPKWVRSGERSEIRVHSPEPYQLTLWRYGRAKEFVSTVSWFDEHGPRTTLQILPDGDFTQSGVQWNRHGYPSEHPQQFITAPERSGLYYLWVRTPSGRTFSFPWVVAPAKPKCKLAVLASTNTWNVYNNFGGRSNYVNPNGLPALPTTNARLDLDRYTQKEPCWRFQDSEFKPLSFERPEIGNDIFDNKPWDSSSIADPIQGRMQCGQAPGEWRLAGWLEEQGFEYDYYSEAQLHDGTLPLDAYDVLVIAVHPEYWSREMYSTVDEWVKHKSGRLIYLGGNGINCEVKFGSDATLTCLTHDDTNEPDSGHESRMHRTWKSEAALLGVVFSYTGVMTAAPYRVVEQDHWIFQGTNLRNGDLFGERTLHERVPGGASGHETDKISANSPAGLRVLAKGTNVDGGGGEIVCFDHGAGMVFSVGSITWVSALFADDAVSKVTGNVVRRFLSDRR